MTQATRVLHLRWQWSLLLKHPRICGVLCLCRSTFGWQPSIGCLISFSFWHLMNHRVTITTSSTNTFFAHAPLTNLMARSHHLAMSRLSGRCMLRALCLHVKRLLMYTIAITALADSFSSHSPLVSQATQPVARRMCSRVDLFAPRRAVAWAFMVMRGRRFSSFKK